MLRWRLALGTLFIFVVALLCWLDAVAGPAGFWLFPLAVIVAVGATGELLWLLEGRSCLPRAAVVYTGNLVIVIANFLPHTSDAFGGRLNWPVIALAVSLLLAFLAEMRAYERPGVVSERLAGAAFCFIYVGLLLSFVIQLRFVAAGTGGIASLISLLLVVKAGDIGAYTVGRLAGRRKMAPVLSPGKTYEGAIGGLLFACAGAWIALRVIYPALAGEGFIPVRVWSWVVFGLLVGAAGMFGDLAESLLKRDVGKKDSSPWMPGFGGVLDLLDSILAGAPIAYACWMVGIF